MTAVYFPSVLFLLLVFETLFVYLAAPGLSSGTQDLVLLAAGPPGKCQ